VSNEFLTNEASECVSKELLLLLPPSVYSSSVNRCHRQVNSGYKYSH